MRRTSSSASREEEYAVALDCQEEYLAEEYLAHSKNVIATRKDLYKCFGRLCRLKLFDRELWLRSSARLLFRRTHLRRSFARAGGLQDDSYT